jgi:hypothetical protein
MQEKQKKKQLTWHQRRMRIKNEITDNWHGWFFIAWLTFCFSGIFWGRDLENDIHVDTSIPIYYLGDD